MLVSCEELVEGLADQSQREIIGGSAAAEYLDLDLNWEAPRGRGWRVDMA